MTCCCICNSYRGAAYFCSSVQIFIGLYLFMKWILIAIFKGSFVEYFEDERLQIVYPLLIIYITIFITFGCINFIAIQRESGKVVKWTTVLLFLNQLLEISGHISLGFLFPDADNDYKIHQMFHIQRLAINILGSAVYFTVLFLYSKELINGIYVLEDEKKKKDGSHFKLKGKESKGKKNSKSKLNSLPMYNDETLNLGPSAPPPTPGPSHNEDYDADIDADSDDAPIPSTSNVKSTSC